jgi:hypothetical protein
MQRHDIDVGRNSEYKIRIKSMRRAKQITDIHRF